MKLIIDGTAKEIHFLSTKQSFAFQDKIVDKQSLLSTLHCYTRIL